MENVVAVIFDVESEAYQALTETKNKLMTSGYTVMQMSLIKKENGTIKTLEAVDSGFDTTDDTIAGTLIGSLVGIFAGPLGLLIGGSTGALVGSFFDLDDTVNDVSLLQEVNNKLPENQAILTALVQETDEKEFDHNFDKFNTTILRFDAATVAHEIEEAEKLQKTMQHEAKRQLHEERVAKRKESIQEKRNKLHSDFESFKNKVSHK